MTMPAQTPPDRAPVYLRVEAARLSLAIDQAVALLRAKAIVFTTADLLACAAVLIEMRHYSRMLNPPPEEPNDRRRRSPTEPRPILVHHYNRGPFP